MSAGPFRRRKRDACLTNFQPENYGPGALRPTYHDDTTAEDCHKVRHGAVEAVVLPVELLVGALRFERGGITGLMSRLFSQSRSALLS